jgi:hypothetical protein
MWSRNGKTAKTNVEGSKVEVEQRQEANLNVNRSHGSHQYQLLCDWLLSESIDLLNPVREEVPKNYVPAKCPLTISKTRICSSLSRDISHVWPARQRHSLLPKTGTDFFMELHGDEHSNHSDMDLILEEGSSIKRPKRSSERFKYFATQVRPLIRAYFVMTDLRVSAFGLHHVFIQKFEKVESSSKFVQILQARIWRDHNMALFLRLKQVIEVIGLRNKFGFIM